MFWREAAPDRNLGQKYATWNKLKASRGKANGTLLASDDNCADTKQALIQASGLASANVTEPAGKYDRDCGAGKQHNRQRPGRSLYFVAIIWS
ncbi:MAG: hypothetical protein DME32_04705 [Verrucomicrobia bacterium]|nr:MAG: hypothetical protein DME42_12710 [Verrucomicrobiota bacterium]PYL03156.1 MAG: hypothetical protein DME32_04705 [Verrucomicrobiota bacterium]